MDYRYATLFLVIGFESLGLAEADPETLKALRRIHAPKVVAVPPENACRGLMVMPDGEIRHYGFRHEASKKGDAFRPVYITSRDCGLSWREVAAEGAVAGAMVRSPWSGDFLTVLCKTGPRHPQHGLRRRFFNRLTASDCSPSVSSQGPQGPFTHSVAGTHRGFMARLPLPLRGQKRWVQPIQCRVDGPTQPGVLLSDNDGVSWREVLLP